MSERLILVANRLPVTAVQRDGGGFDFRTSIGGLATGLSHLKSVGEVRWVGWSGLVTDDLTDSEINQLDGRLLQEYGCHHVHLSQERVNAFYEGFSNNTLWPLFHYFPAITEFSSETWQAYRDVNRLFLETLERMASPEDTFWVHDYQLLLLPRLIRDRFPKAKIGFFLHIPFPSYELFKLLPWRKEILLGLLGADLIGFHTFDYARHFLSSTRRILGFEHHMGTVWTEHSRTVVDVFPMGIDVERFRRSTADPAILANSRKIADDLRGRTIVLSVDRLDYTKGIPQKLSAFKKVLQEAPRLRGSVVLILIVAPSRTNVARYQALKQEIEELVSSINGEFGSLDWTPIRYFFQVFQQDHLVALYLASDVFLVTPLRDGMNLTAKEYLVCRGDRGGTLILSENAGAAFELVEADIVNPNDRDDIAQKLLEAIENPPDPGDSRARRMLQRIESYSLDVWIEDFLQALDRAFRPSSRDTPVLDEDTTHAIRRSYRRAQRRLLFLDYDGTLVPFASSPELAIPSDALLELIRTLAADERNLVVVISGRDRGFLERAFGHLPIGLAASHGAWIRHVGEPWRSQITLDPTWVPVIRPILQKFTHRTPGSFIEEKEFSLAWHFRRVEPELAQIRLYELKEALLEFTNVHRISVLEGNKVIEVKPNEANKGNIGTWLGLDRWDFILAIGDDQTDEDLFQAIPPEGITVKVGKQPSKARYRLPSVGSVLAFLQRLAKPEA